MPELIKVLVRVRDNEEFPFSQKAYELGAVTKGSLAGTNKFRIEERMVATREEKELAEAARQEKLRQDAQAELLRQSVAAQGARRRAPQKPKPSEDEKSDGGVKAEVKTGAEGEKTASEATGESGDDAIKHVEGLGEDELDFYALEELDPALERGDGESTEDFRARVIAKLREGK